MFAHEQVMRILVFKLSIPLQLELLFVGVHF